MARGVYRGTVADWDGGPLHSRQGAPASAAIAQGTP
jgi:hypothetical protein